MYKFCFRSEEESRKEKQMTINMMMEATKRKGKCSGRVYGMKLKGKERWKQEWKRIWHVDWERLQREEMRRWKKWKKMRWRKRGNLRRTKCNLSVVNKLHPSSLYFSLLSLSFFLISFTPYEMIGMAEKRLNKESEQIWWDEKVCLVHSQGWMNGGKRKDGLMWEREWREKENERRMEMKREWKIMKSIEEERETCLTIYTGEFYSLIFAIEQHMEWEFHSENQTRILKSHLLLC